MNTEAKVNDALNYICKISGEAALPVRTSFELTQALNCFFSKLEPKPCEWQEPEGKQE